MTALNRLRALYRTLEDSKDDPCILQILNTIQEAILADPELPRTNPTISLWQEPGHPKVSAIQSDQLPEFTDYVVIGSGITGCSVTKTLLEHPKLQDAHVTVLEARTLVSGATGRNGGHLVSAAGHTYQDLARRYGVDNAKQITRFSIMNINYILKMVREMDSQLQIDSQIRDVIKVMAAGDLKTWERARTSLAAFKSAVPEHRDYHRVVEQADIEEVSRFYAFMLMPLFAKLATNFYQRWNVKNSFGAIEHEAGAVWPYRLLTGIYERLLTRYTGRLHIETNTPVTEIDHTYITSSDSDSDSYPYSVITPRGTIRARQIVHCTNAFASHLLPALRGKVYPFRGTMSVQKAGPLLRNVGDCRSWSSMNQASLNAQTGLYRTGLVYLQQNALTGDIWVGTESSHIRDVLTSDDTYVVEEARNTLQSFLPEFFHQGWKQGTTTAEIEGIWTGIQGHTADGLPLVGQLPECISGRRVDANGEWIAAGFNGYGMDKCWLTGEALVKMMMGEDVSKWFPQCYIINEKRFHEDLKVERVLDKFSSIARTGSW